MRLVALVVTLTTLVGCRSDPDKCERGCRNYHKLVFWEAAEAEIAKLPSDKRDAARRDKLVQFEKEEKWVDWCTSKCVSENFSDQVDCLVAATTAKQAKECKN
jgi:hypothetical protein